MTACRVLFTGSRDWTDKEPVRAVVDALPPDAVVIHGDCNREKFKQTGKRVGLDMIVDELALARGLKVEAYPADWKAHGKGAGPIRNQRMLDEGKPTEAHAFPLPSSRGTLDMIARCKAAGVRGLIHRSRARATKPPK